MARAAGAWPANDALCDALQVINHLQDCGKDYRELDRVYIPLDRAGGRRHDVEALDAQKANPGPDGVIAAWPIEMPPCWTFPGPSPADQDGRLALEVDLIQTLAEDLNRRLMVPRSFVPAGASRQDGGRRRCSLKRFPASDPA